MTTSLAPRAAPPRCSASTEGIAVVVNVDGQAEALGHHVSEGDVAQRQVDGDGGDPGAAIDQGRDPEADRLDLHRRRVLQLAHRGHGDIEDRAGVQAPDSPLHAAVHSEGRVHRAGEQFVPPRSTPMTRRADISSLYVVPMAGEPPHRAAGGDRPYRVYRGGDGAADRRACHRQRPYTTYRAGPRGLRERLRGKTSPAAMPEAAVVPAAGRAG